MIHEDRSSATPGRKKPSRTEVDHDSLSDQSSVFPTRFLRFVAGGFVRSFVHSDGDTSLLRDKREREREREEEAGDIHARV